MAVAMKRAAAKSKVLELTTRQKLLVGALGAVTPLALNLLVVDQVTLQHLTVLVAVSYAIRVVVLVSLGALVVYLNAEETNRTRIFQLGLAAPALITGLMNGVNQRALAESQQFVAPKQAAVLSMEAVYAAELEPQAKQFVIPEESQAQQILRGLTGARSDRVWFVIASRLPNQAAAAAAAGHITRTFKGFSAEVYQPYQGQGSWSVVIGAGLTRADAMRLRERAVAAGMADADLWTPPPSKK
jgi:hypothetical protein